MIAEGDRQWWCSYCGEDLPADMVEGWKKYCGPSCSRNDWNTKKRAQRVKQCAFCSKEFIPHVRHGVRSTNYCSDECRVANRRKGWRERSHERYHTDATYRDGMLQYHRDYRARMRANDAGRSGRQQSS